MMPVASESLAINRERREPTQPVLKYEPDDHRKPATTSAAKRARDERDAGPPFATEIIELPKTNVKPEELPPKPVPQQIAFGKLDGHEYAGIIFPRMGPVRSGTDVILWHSTEEVEDNQEEWRPNVHKQYESPVCLMRVVLDNEGGAASIVDPFVDIEFLVDGLMMER